MGKEILTDPQKAALAFIAHEPRLSSFYLSEGTALAAYYLHHRVSDDLDFFTPEAPDIVFLHELGEQLKQRLKARAVNFQRLYDRNIFEFLGEFGVLKVEFTKYPFPQLEPPTIINEVRVDSFPDVSANKLMAMLDRFDPKDFADLFFIFKKRSLQTVWRDAEKKFDITIDPLFLGAELAKVRRVAGLPHMMQQLTVEELKAFFSDRARELKGSILL